MKLVIIFGPPAVGKMTVGYELSQRTGLKLFHNHMTIDPLLNIFEWGQPAFHRLVAEFRRRIFEEVARSELPGLIFTYVWALDHESDKADIDSICDIFRARGAEIYFVELQAGLDARLERNQSDFRLAQKPSKRDIERSRGNILGWEGKYKMNTDAESDFFYPANYLKLENTDLSAAEAARRIIQEFGFEVQGEG
ncbi:MAG: AAA family ATPase [Anaerolineae bacterium]|nr:AAA family ATPase [Anaerolineae bacterium]